MICTLIRQFIHKKITNQQNFNILLGYLKAIVRKTASKYKINDVYWKDEIEDIVLDVLGKIYKESNIWKMLVEQQKCKAYLYITVKNYLLDKIRQKERNVKATSFRVFKNEEGKQISEEEIIKDNRHDSELMEALIDLLEDFQSKISKDDIKYFCYFLLPNGKKLYKCLWQGKSKDAIYQDVKRKKDKILIPFLKEWVKLGVDREAIELFIKIYLSEICEQLRSFYCQEDAK